MSWGLMGKHVVLFWVYKRRNWGKAVWCSFETKFFSRPSSPDPSEDTDAWLWITHSAQTAPLSLSDVLPSNSQWLVLGQEPSAAACGLQLVCRGSEHCLCPELLAHPHCWERIIQPLWMVTAVVSLAGGYSDLPPWCCHVLAGLGGFVICRLHGLALSTAILITSLERQSSASWLCFTEVATSSLASGTSVVVY